MQYKGRNCSSGMLEIIPFLYLWKFVLGSITGLGDVLSFGFRLLQDLWKLKSTLCPKGMTCAGVSDPKIGYVIAAGSQFWMFGEVRRRRQNFLAHVDNILFFCKWFFIFPSTAGMKHPFLLRTKAKPFTLMPAAGLGCAAVTWL